MYIAPECLTKLQGRDDPAGIGHQQAQRCQFLGGQVNRRFTAQKGAVGFQTEARKGELWLFKPGLRKYAVASEPTQFFGLLVNQSADVTPPDLGESEPPSGSRTLLAVNLGKR